MKTVRWITGWLVGVAWVFAVPGTSSGQFSLVGIHQAPGPGGSEAAARTDPPALPLGPYAQYVTPSEAMVYWWTAEDCSSILEYGLAGPGAKHSPSIRLIGPHQGSLENRIEDSQPKKRHAMKIRGLRPNEVYAYRVTVKRNGSEASTDVYELDTAMNYSVHRLPAAVRAAADSERMKPIRDVAREILLRTGVHKGYCLVWGLVDGTLAHELAARSDLVVIGVDNDADRVRMVREKLYRTGVYGTRISVQHVDSLANLPYPKSFANLLVSERLLAEGNCPGLAEEMYRVLRPRGGAAVLCSRPENAAAVEKWLEASSIDSQKQEMPPFLLHTVAKPVLPGVGSWTHQYGDAGNTADSHDELGGATRTDHLQVQWLGRPGADFGLDRNPRMPAPLTAAGRLFHQGMNRMVALDTYNGAVLWSLEIPAMQRVNMPRDASNWCTDDGFLYVAIRDLCWVIDHQDGRLAQVYELPDGFASQRYDWGYVACKDRTLFGSAVAPGTIYTEFWGHEAWYDKTAGAGTGKVCSEALFAYDLSRGELLWKRRGGLAVNTTLAIGEHNILFVESRNETLKELPLRRLNEPSLWSDQYLVCLNARTGELAWERPLDTADGTVVFFLACRENAIVIASSAKGKYHLYRFNADTGESLWHVEHQWPSDNHGGHMQHPVVLADRIFLEPCGYDLQTGRRLHSSMSGREGCATYCGTKHTLIHRGRSRWLTMWDFNTGRITGWCNLRPSCWLSTIVGEGMVLSPEGGGGCSCGNWLETSLAFAPLIAPPVTRADARVHNSKLNEDGE